jgi:hypothetical protein
MGAFKTFRLPADSWSCAIGKRRIGYSDGFGAPLSYAEASHRNYRFTLRDAFLTSRRRPTTGHDFHPVASPRRMWL